MSKIKVLIVEDEALTASLLKRNFELMGYEACDPVSTGEAAVDLVGTEQPDVVLMDVRLAGGMDGIETAERIAALYGTPVIFMTGYSDQETMARAASVKPAAYLTKPVTPDHVIPVIKRLSLPGCGSSHV